MTVMSCEFESHFLHHFAEIAQLVEHNLAKVRVASSSLVFRSQRSKALGLFFLFKSFFSSLLYPFCSVCADFNLLRNLKTPVFSRFALSLISFAA